ncbi:FxSxx-COOH system tetratricopeptide repeat protein [Cryptosporangium japonicum]|uniref:FxSxx-COOH system tetratricopeptide repeat protein n=1 Tax=Cryptosporangium japonicum TaxID=80872 RepID=A0ABN0V9X4_9ACTN
MSYTAADRKWAEWIAWVLEDNGLRVVLQDWDFVPGTDWVRRMEDAVLRSDRMLVLCSPAYLSSSDYGRMEWQVALRADPAAAERRLVPVKIRDCTVPGVLGGLTWIDLTGRGEAEAERFLLDRLTAADSGRAKPTERPGFPGAEPTGAPVPRPDFPGRLPPVFNVRRPNPRFTGREHLLARLGEALRSTGRVTVASVRGLGGVGKTETAVEYCHRHATGYDTVWWIDAEDPGTIPAQLAELGALLGVAADPGDAVATAQQVRHRLARQDDWLLVFDNAEDPAGITTWIPDGGRGAVLVTTRRTGYQSLGPVLEVPVWERAESLEFLTERRPDITRTDAEHLAETLGDLPLALEQAAAYLDTAQLTPTRYLELWDKAGDRLLGRGHATGHTQTVATVWTVAMDRIAGESPAAEVLLRVCALLAPEPIPTGLFTAAPEPWPPVLARAVEDELEFEDALGILASYALITRDRDTIRLHRLVQTVTTTSTPPPQREELLRAVLASLRAACRFDVTAPAASAWWRGHLPHVLTCARAGLRRPRPAQSARARTDASVLLHATGRYLGEIGQVGQAVELLETALTSDTDIFGPDHVVTLTTRQDLAGSRGETGDPDAAADTFADVVDDCLRVLGPDHLHTLIARHNLANWRGRAGDPDAAADALAALLDDCLRVLGPDHSQTLTSRHALARWRGKAGNPDAAADALAALLDDHLRVLGPEHPHTLTTRHNLAYWRAQAGNPAAAADALADLLDDRRRVLGPDHPQTLTTRHNLACWRGEAGDPHAAADALAELLDDRLRVLGPDHPHTRITRVNLEYWRRKAAL